MDVDKLISALDNKTNESIIGLTTTKILELNLKILKELHLDKKTTLDYLKKLKDYRYIDEINDLNYGGYIRWVQITDPNNLILNQCGIICDIVITDTGVCIVCKNFMHRHYRIKMEECLIFQKLNSQERIILSALNHLETTEPNPKKEGNNEESEDSDSSDSDFESEI